MTRDFEAYEFTCKCGCGYNDIKIKLVNVLQVLRNRLGLVIKIASGCRCAAHNKNEGGSATSSHLDGWAVDIVIPNSAYAYKIMQAIFELRVFTRIGFGKMGKDTVLHLDIDPHKSTEVFWGY